MHPSPIPPIQDRRARFSKGHITQGCCAPSHLRYPGVSHHTYKYQSGDERGTLAQLSSFIKDKQDVSYSTQMVQPVNQRIVNYLFFLTFFSLLSLMLFDIFKQWKNTWIHKPLEHAMAFLHVKQNQQFDKANIIYSLTIWSQLSFVISYMLLQHFFFWPKN